MADKPKTPRHMLSMVPKAFARLEEFKKELESKMQFRMTYSQVIVWLINNQKEM